MSKSGFCYNNKGQRAGNCLEFSWNGKNGNCQLYPDWQEKIHPCIVCKGEFCNEYNGKLLSLTS